MGNHQTKNPEFEEAKKQFSESELRLLEQSFFSMAHQSRSEGKYVIEPVFQSYYKINGVLGESIFRTALKNPELDVLIFDDFIVFKSKYEKESPLEIERCIYSFLSRSSNTLVRSNLTKAIQNMLQIIFEGKNEEQLSYWESLLKSPKFSKSETDPVLTFTEFRAWCQTVPSVRKFLGSLLSNPTSGAVGRTVPSLMAPDTSSVILKSVHAWHILGMLNERESKAWSLQFTSASDGLSFNTFMGKVSSVKGPTVMVVRDKQGFMFGGYASQAWERHSDYFGDMKSFLFSLHPSAAIYRPSGANTNLQWCAINFTSESIPNGVGFGGQVGHFGLFLDGNFERGHSRPSVTFNSPCLSSTPSFDIDTVEVWRILNPSEEGSMAASPGLKGTILERFKEDRAVLNLVGIANASDSVGE